MVFLLRSDFTAALWTYRLWVLVYASALIFLIDAFKRINTQVNFVADKNVSKGAMVFQAISSFLFTLTLLLDVEFHNHLNLQLIVLIVTIWVGSANVCSLMYQWLNIVKIAQSV